MDVSLYADYEKSCMKLLDALFRVVNANTESPIEGKDDRYWYAEGLATKYFLHASTLLYLYHETRIGLPSAKIKVLDIGSAAVVVRAAFETCLTFYHIFVSPETEEEQDYRYWAYRLGITERQSLPVSTEEYKAKLNREKELIDEFQEKLRSNSIFNRLTKKQQASVLKGNWRWVPGDNRPLSWQRIAAQAGFETMIASQGYTHLSGYAHSSSLSILQIKQALQRREPRRLVQSSLGVVNVLTANLTRFYADLFPKAKELLGSDSNASSLVGGWIFIGRNLNLDASG